VSTKYQKEVATLFGSRTANYQYAIMWATITPFAAGEVGLRNETQHFFECHEWSSVYSILMGYGILK